MKKFIAASLIALTLAGCSSNPAKGHYDENGNYIASKEAVDADRWDTLGAVAVGAAAVAGLALGIVAVTK